MKTKNPLGLICLIIVLSGCAAPSGTILPTSTPAPAPETPTLIPTFTPPPTVTPFPTGSVATQDSAVLMPGEASATLSGVDSTPVPPGIALPAITAIPDRGPVLFSSDFSIGWPGIDTETSSVGIVNGQYLFEVGPFDGTYITTTSITSGQYYAEVVVYPEQCPAKAGYGLLFNYKDASNYYVVTIYCDDRFTIAGRKDGTIFDVGIAGAAIPGGMTSGSGSHTLGVVSDNGDFVLMFDNIILATFKDGRQPSGDVAVYVTSQGSDVIRVAFDDLSVFSLN